MNDPSRNEPYRYDPSRSDRDLNTILCWAAGADRDVSGIPSVDADRLLLLLSRHKLQVRCAARAKAERPPWYTRALSIPLWQTARAVRAQVQRRIDALCEMTAALPHTDGPPIPIKGFTAYALTGDENTIRPSGDMDLFFPDWDQAKAVLLGLDYIDLNVPREQNAVWSHHELAKIVRDSLLVEVHDFCPVFGYPGVDISDPHAGRPGWVTETVYKIWVEFRIRYADLRDHIVPVRSAGGDYWVTDPQMAALVLCAHIFRDYVEECAYQLTTPIPLAEVADLHDIARLPEFDPAQFLALTEKCKAQHSVALAGQVLRACFGTNDLPVPVPTPDYYAKRVFPQSINRYRADWAVLGSLEGLPTRRMDEVLAGLGGANTIPVGESYSVVHTAGGPTAPVVVVQDNDGQIPPLQFSLAWTDDALCFALHLSPVADSEEDVILVNFGDAVDGCWRCRGTEDTLFPHRGTLHGDASVTVHPNGYTLHLSLPWPQIAGKAQSDGELLLILTVNRLPASTLVPLCLIRE